MSVLDAIVSRRSIPQFQPTPVPREIIKRLLDAAVWVPNHRLTEPWQFHVLGETSKRRFAEIRRDFRAATMPNPKAPEVQPALAKIVEDTIHTPVIIIVTAQGHDDPELREENYWAAFGAVYAFMLGAWSLGIGTYFRTGAFRDHPPLREEPAGPVLAWLGEPAALPGMLHAFGLVRASVPDARLIVIGAAPEGPRRTGVSFSGPVTRYRGLFAQAGVLVISGAHQRMPYPLIEAMLSGRATVCTENGGLADTVGLGASVVPPDDPVRLAAACVDLLTDERLRRELGTMARNRARTLFRLGGMLDSYREIYEKALVSRPEPAERLVGAS